MKLSTIPFLIAVLVASSTSAYGQWTIESIDPSDEDAGAYSSIVLDEQDNVHISYFRKPYAKSGAGECSLMYAFNDGSSWVLTAVDVEPWDSYSFGQTTIKLDSNGYPHIAYRIDYTLKYARWNGSEWQTETTPGKSCISMALDSNDVPHLAYYDYTDHSIGYAVLNGATWESAVLDNYSGTCEGTSIVIDSSGNPMVAYYNYGSVKFAERDGSDWTITVVDDGPGIGYWPSLALDSSDNPRISYCDYYNADLKYAEFNGNSWTVHTVESAGESGYYSSLAVDIYNEPHISSYHPGSSSLRYVSRSGLDWEASVVEENSGHYTSLALDTTNNPHISYMKYNVSTVHELKYAFSTTLFAEDEYGSSNSGFALAPVSPNPSSCNVVVSFSLPVSCNVDLVLFDINGRNIGSLAEGQYGVGTHEVSIENLSSGVYHVRLVADDFTDSTRMVVLK